MLWANKNIAQQQLNNFLIYLNLQTYNYVYGQKYFQQTGRILNDIGFEIFGFHLISSSGIIKIGRKIKVFFFSNF